MRRIPAKRVRAVLLLIVATLGATFGPATASVAAGQPPSQQQPRSTWVQPGSAPLDGLGTFLYVSPATAGATQGSVLGYEYTLFFQFEDGSGGLVALGYRNNQKVAGFTLMKSHPVVATVPFDWQFGHLYYFLTYRIGTDLWAAWVYDYSAARWTHIDSQPAPGIGRMLPTSSTSVDYDPSLAPTPAADASSCAFYPRVDAFWYPPTGWRGDVMTTAVLGAGSTSPGVCPSVTGASDGWQHYAMGAAG